MKNRKNAKPEDDKEKIQIEPDGIDRPNSDNVKTLLFPLRLGKDLPATETAVKHFEGQFHRIRWHQMLKLAKAMRTLAANLLSVDESKIFLDDILDFGGSQAKVGLQGIIHQDVEIMLINELGEALNLFMMRVTDVRSPGTVDCLHIQDNLSQEAIKLVEAFSTQFLKMNGNSRISVPIEYYFGGRKMICNGQFGKKPLVKHEDPTALTVHGNMDAIIKSKRMFIIKRGKESKSIHFDSEKHLLRLSEILSSEENYSFHVLEEKVGQGDSVFTLENIGDQDSYTLL